MRRPLLALAGVLLLLVAGGTVWLLRGSDPDLPDLPRIDRIVIHKGARDMQLWSGGRLVHTMHGVALGNAPKTDAVIDALQSRREHPSSVVREHVEWALAQHARI